MTDKFKLKIKQFFCHHEWEKIEEERFSDISQGYRVECFSGTFKCNKCGKISHEFERVRCQ